MFQYASKKNLVVDSELMIKFGREEQLDSQDEGQAQLSDYAVFTCVATKRYRFIDLMPSVALEVEKTRIAKYTDDRYDIENQSEPPTGGRHFNNVVRKELQAEIVRRRKASGAYDVEISVRYSWRSEDLVSKAPREVFAAIYSRDFDDNFNEDMISLEVVDVTSEYYSLKVTGNVDLKLAMLLRKRNEAQLSWGNLTNSTIFGNTYQIDAAANPPGTLIKLSYGFKESNIVILPERI